MKSIRFRSINKIFLKNFSEHLIVTYNQNIFRHTMIISLMICAITRAISWLFRETHLYRITFENLSQIPKEDIKRHFKVRHIIDRFSGSLSPSQFCFIEIFKLGKILSLSQTAESFNNINVRSHIKLYFYT